MKVLKILKCSDSMMWYRNLVGKYVPVAWEESDLFMSREPAGYRNIVKKQDAEIVHVSDNTELY